MMSCPICGRIKANSPHHIIPRSEGGEDFDKNLVYLCRICHDEVEENPELWARFLRCYHSGDRMRMGKLKVTLRETRKMRLKIARKVRLKGEAKSKEGRVGYITPEGTPNWLAKELGVPGRAVRTILRAKYPRSPEQRRNDWGVLTQEQQDVVRQLVSSLNNSNLHSLLSKSNSNAI